MTSGPRTVTANGVELCVQTFGSPPSPALLLVGGMAMSMDWWEDEFCERLASGRGEALAREIPGARLVLLEGMGHEVPPRPLWDQVVAEVLDHTA